MKKITVSICILLILLLSSCTPIDDFIVKTFLDYAGKDRDLYTAAVANVFGAYGNISNGEVCYSPVMTVIETDDYGRKLYFYSEYDYSPEQEPTALIITQKSESNRVYYYQDMCVMPYLLSDADISFYLENYKTNDRVKHIIENSISKNDLDDFKEKNDWGKEINTSKCTSTGYVKNIADKWGIDKFTDDIYEYVRNSDVISNGYSIEYLKSYQALCNYDKNGLELYKATASVEYKDGREEEIYSSYNFAVIYDTKTKKAKLIELTDVITCYDKIAEMKLELGWEHPAEFELK